MDSAGETHSGRSIGKCSCFPFRTPIFDTCFTLRVYLEKYKTCRSAGEVTVMQDAILAELENNYEESRKDKGWFTAFRNG